MKTRTKIIMGLIGVIFTISGVMFIIFGPGGMGTRSSYKLLAPTSLPQPETPENIPGPAPTPPLPLAGTGAGPTEKILELEEAKGPGPAPTPPRPLAAGREAPIGKILEPEGTKGSGPAPTPPPPPPAAQSAIIHEDIFSAIDKILEKLELGNIAFNAPRSMNLHNTAIIQLILGLSKAIDELKRMIEAEGEKEGASIRVSDKMEARLTGPNFSITAITDETQVVSRSNVTEWKWEVKPNMEGRQNLHLTLSVVLNGTPRVIRTFDKVIHVEVNWHQRVGSFLEKNWQWLWAVVLVPIAGWLWRRKKGRKSSASQSGN